MNCSILKQVKYKTEADVEKDHVIIKFPSEKLEYTFQMQGGTIIVNHKSQAVIAAVTGKLIRYKSTDIEATNKIFDWMNIPYEIDYHRLSLKNISSLKDGVISFF